MPGALDVKTLLEQARAGLDARIEGTLGLGDGDSLDQAQLFRGYPAPSERFVFQIVLEADDPLDGEFGFLFDDTDYKYAYITVVRSLDRAKERPVPARVVLLHWRSFHGSDGAREAAELVYEAIDQVAAATDRS